jgi:membrane protein implicated in regulation of membrane protease activity
MTAIFCTISAIYFAKKPKESLTVTSFVLAVLGSAVFAYTLVSNALLPHWIAPVLFILSTTCMLVNAIKNLKSPEKSIPYKFRSILAPILINGGACVFLAEGVGQTLNIELKIGMLGFALLGVLLLLYNACKDSRPEVRPEIRKLKEKITECFGDFVYKIVHSG